MDFHLHEALGLNFAVVIIARSRDLETLDEWNPSGKGSRLAIQAIGGDGMRAFLENNRVRTQFF